MALLPSEFPPGLSDMPTERIFVSSGAFPSDDLPTVLDLAERWGVMALELSSGLRHRPDLLRLTRKAHGRLRLLLHNYFPAPANPFVLNLASLEPDTLRRSLSHCRRALQLSADLGCGFFSVHAGFAANAQARHLGRSWDELETVSRSEAFAVFIAAIRDMTTHAASLGLDFLIENNVLAPFNWRADRPSPLLGVTAEELLELVDAVNSPNFGILMDVGHLKVSACTLGFDPGEALDRLLPAIRAFHLSDNDGLADTNQPFGPDAWFLPWLARKREVPLIIEAYHLDEATLIGCRDILAGL